MSASTKWARTSALCGAAVWVALAGLAGNRNAPLGVIELLFLFAVLVIVPLGLALATRLSPLQGSAFDALLCRAQPFAAALVVTSFWLRPGWSCGIFVVPWFLLCSAVALMGALALLREKNRSLTTWAVNIGRMDLAIAGGWLVISRSAIHPLGIQEPIVLLTAVHFHYTGFAMALLVGSLAAFLRTREGNRGFAVLTASVLAIPFVVAAGFVWSATLKMAGGVALSISVLILAVLQFWFAGDLKLRPARIFLRISALAVAVGMVLASTYAIGDWLKQDWLLIPRMASTHGVLNGLGFCLLGLLGWLMEFYERPSTQ